MKWIQIALNLKSSLLDYPWKRITSRVTPFLGYSCEFGDYTVEIYVINVYASNTNCPEPFSEYATNNIYNVFVLKDNQSISEKELNNFFAPTGCKIVKGRGDAWYASSVPPDILLYLAQYLTRISLETAPKPDDKVCPECKGKKILDFEFYTRQCMRCYSE